MAVGRRVLVYFLSAYLLHSVFSEDTVGVAVFNEVGAPRTDSWMQFKGEVPTMTKFTVCLRVRFFQFMNPSTFISYAVLDCDDELFLNYDVRFSRLVIGCCNGEFSFDFQVHFIPLRWKSFCIRVDLKSSLAEMFHDESQRGQPKLLDKTSSSEFYVRGGGKLFIGQDQDTVGGNFDPYESLKAKLADLHVLPHFLNSSSLINYTQMKRLSASDFALFSFSVFQDFRLSNVYTLQATRKSALLTNEPIPFLRLFSRRVSFHNAQSLCQALGGKIYLPRNHYENDVLFQLTSRNPEFCDKTMFSKDILWLGANTFGSKAPWTHYLSNETLNFTNLNDADDIRTSETNFALTFVGCDFNSSNSKKSWSFTTTSQTRRVVCEFDRIPLIRFRGMTPDIPYDRNYFLDEKIVNPILIGLHSSTLMGIHDNNTAPSMVTWQLKNFWIDDDILSFTSSPSNIYPFGTKTWTRSKDGSDTRIVLVVTACLEGEFTCDDSSCVNISKRCDLERNCFDGSDEEDCFIVLSSVTKTIGLPPPKSPDKEYFELSVYFEIVWVHDLQLDSFTLISDVIMKSEWYDPTQSFLNLKEESHLNSVPTSVSSYLWKPSFELNGDCSTLSTIENFNERLNVKKRTRPLADDLIRLRAEQCFAGSKNPFSSRQSFTVKTKCNIQLERFPFDLQVCHVMVFWQCNIKNIRLLPLHEGQFVEFKGEKNLLQYSVQRVSAKVINQSLCPALLVELAFQNRSVYYVFYTFLPSLMLMVVGYMTFYFPLDDFQDRIMVALTAMLVQTTFFTQVGDHLPRTSYLKLIDVWCVLCIAMLFCIILALVIINHFYESASEQKEEKSQSGQKETGVQHAQTQISSSLDSTNNTKSQKVTTVHRLSREFQTASVNKQSSFNTLKNAMNIGELDEESWKAEMSLPDDSVVPRVKYSNDASDSYAEQTNCWEENLSNEQVSQKSPLKITGEMQITLSAAALNRFSAWWFAGLIVTLIVVYTSVAVRDVIF